jgi:regulator of sigma E protease
MSYLNWLWTYAVPFLLVITPLVFVHELGHFWAARRAGVRVEVFSVGFGREIFGWTDRLGTRWKIGWLPLGGYVRMYGDSDAASSPGAESEQIPPEHRRFSFHHQPVGTRAIIAAAGPVANFLLAIVLLAGIFFAVGRTFVPPVIGGVVEGMPAAAAGLLPGDRILEINGSSVERFSDIQRVMIFNLDRPVTMTIERDRSRLKVSITPRIVEQTDRFGNTLRIPRLGIQAAAMPETEKIDSPFQAVVLAVEETWFQTWGSLVGIGQMITGRRGADDLGGVLRIAKTSGDAAQLGWISVLSLAVTLSITLGLLNLFPIPMLDGGHLLFCAIEAVRGRPLGPRAQEYGFRVGFALVFALMIFATWNDLVHLGFVKKLVSLVS